MRSLKIRGIFTTVSHSYSFRSRPEGSRLRSSPSLQNSLTHRSAQYTTKSQLIFMLKNTLYTRDNRFMLLGDWRYLVFSQATYVLGTSSPEGGLVDFQYRLAVDFGFGHRSSGFYLNITETF